MARKINSHDKAIGFNVETNETVAAKLTAKPVTRALTSALRTQPLDAYCQKLRPECS